MINDIIIQSIKVGIPIKIELESNDFIYTIDGFYKSGSIKLKVVDGELIATARYDEKTTIKEPKDIVRLNLEWFNFSRDRLYEWRKPKELWLGLFKQFDLESELESE